jgi:hypothetical protein
LEVTSWHCERDVVPNRPKWDETTGRLRRVRDRF